MKSTTFRWTLLGLMAFSLTGCPPKKQVKTEEPKLEDQQQAKPADEPSLRGKEYKEMAEINTVYFDLDQATLRSDARDILSKNYEVIKDHADWEVLVEGHCDERGTTEYNLGLGQKRAAAIRQYYVSLGMSGGKVATISYGKENPACSDHTESCWGQNRRAVTKVRAAESK